jgi:hypothetical protein
MNQLQRIGILSASLLSLTACATKKVYAPAVSASIQPRTGMLVGATLLLGIYDARPDTARFGVIAGAVANAIQSAYPTATVRVLPPSEVHRESADAAVTVRVALAAHAADFGRKVVPAVGLVGGTFVLGVIPEGKWNGLSGFVVTVFDKRNGPASPKSQSLSKLVSKPNTWGYRTARAALDEAFSANLQELLLYLDSSLAR